MKNLTSINIRKGLELEVPIDDIFKVNLEPEGDIIAMKVHNEGWKNTKETRDKSYDDVFKGRDSIMNSTTRKEHVLNDTMTAYVRETYLVMLDELDSGILKPKSDVFTEVDFVNTENLTYAQFLLNVMKAQEFTGRYNNEFKHRFFGIGNFSMKNYMESHNIINCANIHLLDFFVFTDGILSSIGNFFLGNYVKDIEFQKEYFTDEEYYVLMEEAEKHRKLITQEIQEMWRKMNK